MAKEGTLNLLIAHDNSDDASRLISLLEGASYRVDAQAVNSVEELAPLLQSRCWDLAIGQLQATNLPAKKLMASIRSQSLDIPTILISTNSDIVDAVEGIRMGASYVIPVDEDQYFLLATSNTLGQLEQRRVQLNWQERYNAAEARCEELMDSSKNAIALVQDGTYIYTNEPFSQLMGYCDPDDLLMAPVIDTINSSSQEKIRPFLMPLDANTEISSVAIDLSCVTADGQSIDIPVSICQIEYQGEPALQFQIKHDTAVSNSASAQNKQKLTAETTKPQQNSFTVNPQSTIDNIEQAIHSARLSDGHNSIILCVQTDQDTQTRSNTSESNADQILETLAGFVVEQSNKDVNVSRDRRGVINFVIANTTLEEGKAFAENLCQRVAKHTFQVGSQSILLSISASLGPITKNTSSAQVCIRECLKTLDGADPNSALSGGKVYLMNDLGQTDFNVDSEEKITLFGRQLLEKRLIGIAFQPIVGLNDEGAEFYETLMRPKIEEYPKNIPSDFISKVFESPIATEIDRWVILETIKKLADKHNTSPQTCLFINLSAATIQDEKFSPWLKLALKTSNTPPAAITLQLRENDAGRYIEQSKTLIAQLKSIGCKVALTHFGLSSNPLLVLDKLAVNFVKIDRQLIQKIKAGGEEEEETLQMIILLKEMEQHCIAPFIESPTLIPTLWQNGIEYIQGHYIQAPSSQMDYSFNEED